MKKIIFSALMMALVMVSCKDKEATTTTTTTTTSHEMENGSTMMDNDSTMMDSEAEAERLYSCSMHPEVQGKMNDKCSKCGMELTELVPVKK